MADLLNIGLSGLRANQTSLSVTGHNVTNVNTPGYTRQEAVQTTRGAQFSGAGYIGSGATIADVRRLTSQFLTAQVRNNTVVASDVAAYKTQIDQMDSLLAGTVTGISPGLESFFSALQASVESPSDIPARQLVLSQAEGLAKRFNTVYQRIDEQNTYINKQMSSISDQVNRLASSIAQYNDAIATASANGKSPNDLLDSREEALRQLSELIGNQVIEQDGNQVNVFIGSGQPLVVGKQASSIAITPSTDDPNRMQVEFVSGSSRQTITSQVTGGELGGLLRYRNEVLDPTFNSLGRLAMSVSEQVNDQLGQGLDLAGNVGSNLFKDINSPDLQALRSYPTGASVAITDTSKLTTSDYKLDFTNTPPSARRVSDGAAVAITGTGTAADPYVIGDEGFTVSFATAPAAGSSYTIMPTRRGATDIAKELNQPEQLAFAATARASANTQNRGTGAIGQPDMISAPSPINTADLGRLFGTNGLSLTYNATAGTLDGTLPAGATLSYVTPSTTGLTSGQTNTLQLDYTDPVTNNTYSYQFTVSGVPQSGDAFTLGQNQSGVSDNRNGLKLVDLQNKAVIGVTTGADGKPTGSSLTEGYGDLVERVGTLTAQTRTDSEATTSLLKQAQDNRDSLSAVNLDEEAANLIQFEQYYNASAQVIQVARSLFDTLISSIG